MTSTHTGRDETLAGIIRATAEATASDPSVGQVTFRAGATGGEGVRSAIRGSGHEMAGDEPPSLGGDGSAPNPIDYALASLLSCQVVTYRFWAAHLGIPLDDVQVDVEADLDVRGFFGLDEQVRPGLGDIRLVVRLSGPAGEAEYERLRAAVDEHCPVLDLFRNPTSVSVATA